MAGVKTGVLGPIFFGAKNFGSFSCFQMSFSFFSPGRGDQGRGQGVRFDWFDIPFDSIDSTIRYCVRGSWWTALAPLLGPSYELSQTSGRPDVLTSERWDVQTSGRQHIGTFGRPDVWMSGRPDVRTSHFRTSYPYK